MGTGVTAGAGYGIIRHHRWKVDSRTSGYTIDEDDEHDGHSRAISWPVRGELYTQVDPDDAGD